MRKLSYNAIPRGLATEYTTEGLRHMQAGAAAGTPSSADVL
jgi:hypothetical protein